MKLKVLDCSECISTPCCSDKDSERIALVLYFPDSREWKVIYSCCQHYHELKQLEQKNLEICRNTLVESPAPQPKRVLVKETVRYEDYLDI